jgi:hypothetical protein
MGHGTVSTLVLHRVHRRAARRTTPPVRTPSSLKSIWVERPRLFRRESGISDTRAAVYALINPDNRSSGNFGNLHLADTCPVDQPDKVLSLANN